MDKELMRLECIRLANTVVSNPENALKLANEYYEFITGNATKSGD